LARWSAEWRKEQAKGKTLDAALATAQEKRVAGEEVSWPELKELSVLAARPGGDFCAMDFDTRCLEDVRADESRARKLLAEQGFLLERYRALLEVWLYAHVPLAFALLAALIAHVVSVFYFW